nr:TonB-dependent receptor [Bacteroidota bacterium]
MQRFIFFGLLLLSTTVKSQAKISGKVTDNHNKTLPGISISLQNSYDGATSDSSGNFSFTTTEKGAHIISASSSGYKPFYQNINIEGTPLIVNISLKEEITALKAVVISVGTFEASDQKRASALTPLDIVTTASANADITGALKTLPGTQQVGESEGLFVRGGTAAETKIFIDGTLVNKFFYSSEPNLATRGRFNPFLFKGTIF